MFHLARGVEGAPMGRTSYIYLLHEWPEFMVKLVGKYAVRPMDFFEVFGDLDTYQKKHRFFVMNMDCPLPGC